MADRALNEDFDQFVVVRTSKLDWQASPSPNVWRKRLDLSGPVESGRVTSVVKYEPDSAFHSHPHPDGEEIFVLSGIFSDEHGDYPAGSYLLNPAGFEHAPFSRGGCVLFVKLRQYPGDDRTKVAVNTVLEDWQERAPGFKGLTLYSEAPNPETVSLVRLENGAELKVLPEAPGAEMFILDGQCDDGQAVYRTGDWLRWPTQNIRTFKVLEPMTAYLKTGHFPQ